MLDIPDLQMNFILNEKCGKIEVPEVDVEIFQISWNKNGCEKHEMIDIKKRWPL